MARNPRDSLIACIVFTLVLAPACGAAEHRVSRVIDAFVGALTADNLAAFEAISDTRVSGPEWTTIRDLAETSKCIQVHSYRTTIERSDERGATILLDLDASRLTRGAVEERVPVPASWVLDVVCGPEGCRIHSVTKQERVVARAIVAAPPERWESIIRAAMVDEVALARELVDEASFPAVPFEKDPNALSCRRSELTELARNLARRNGDRAAESYCLRILATFDRIFAEGGVPIGKEGVDVAYQSGDPDAIVEALFSLGLARWGRGDIPSALDDLQIASSTLDQLRDPRAGLKALAMKSYIEIQNGKLRQGLASAHRLREESVRYGWVEGEASAASYLGLVHFILNAPEVTRGYEETAYRRAIEARDARGELFALNNLALCDFLADDLDRAVLGYRHAVSRFTADTYKGDQAAIRGGLVVALLRAGRLAEADQVMESVLEIARNAHPAALGGALTILAELRLAQRRPKKALAAANEALALRAGTSITVTDGKGSSFDFWPWSAEVAAGRALRRLGRTREAESAFRRSIAQIEAQRSLVGVGEDAAFRYFEGKLDPYAELAQILAARGRARETLEISERMRARALGAFLEQGKVDVTATMTPAEKERERELNARLAGLNQSLLEKPESDDARSARDAARVELDRFRDELYVSRPTLRVRRPFGGETSALPPALADTVVIEYITVDRGIVVVTARRGRDGRTLTTAKFLPLPQRRLTALTTSFLRAIERRDAGYRDRARELYDLLLLPVEEQLRARRRVCIIPDGVLWRLPFQALVDRGGQHVIERTTLFYAASLRTLALAAALPSGKGLGQLLAFGDPKLSRKAAADAVAFQRDAQVGALPDAHREVEAIRRLYPASATKVLVGAAASEDTFKREAAHYRVLHVAAHGLFDERAPMYSALLLSSPADGSEDGFLEAREIADLSLHSDVAILSACDTARGHYGAGEGLIGMSWALQVAGCPTAIVSQWKAASAPTAVLMIAFHRNLLAGRSKSESLRRAALDLMRTRGYAHPFYWSPFVLVGAP